MLARVVIGAAIEVHRTLGPGLLEKVYEEALCRELTSRGVPYRRQVQVPIFYKGLPIGDGWIDLLVSDRLIVELKSVDQLAPVHVRQVITYLTQANLQLGLLINFNVPLLKAGIRRIVV